MHMYVCEYLLTGLQAQGPFPPSPELFPPACDRCIAGDWLINTTGATSGNPAPEAINARDCDLVKSTCHRYTSASAGSSAGEGSTPQRNCSSDPIILVSWCWRSGVH